jgi:hypothetical protein
MNDLISIESRYEPIPAPITTMIRILRKGKWYQQQPLECSYERAKKIIDRLRRKGRKVEVTFLTGIGLGV